MSTDAGNWKELVRVASQESGGDVTIVRYLLSLGIDPNYQHPEYMTTPLLEAIRVGNHEIVKILLQYNANATLASGLDDTETPLSLALLLKDHDIVDTLLKYLPDYEKELKTVLFTGNYDRDLLHYMLDLGHCVVVVIDNHSHPVDETTRELEEKLRIESSNKKLWFVRRSELSNFFLDQPSSRFQNSNATISVTTKSPIWTPSSIDIWLHLVTKTEHITEEFKTEFPPSEIIGLELKKITILLIINSNDIIERSNQEKLSSLVAHASSELVTIFTVCRPSTWWRNLTYMFWYPSWCNSIARLIGLIPSSPDDPHVATLYGYQGNVYNINLQCIDLH